jgi:DNA (cytosine-5)-methyltransferase 1
MHRANHPSTRITDIKTRHLTPRELATAQGFPADYVLDPEIGGTRLSRSAQVRMIGNAVCRDVAAAIVRANLDAAAARAA